MTETNVTAPQLPKEEIQSLCASIDAAQGIDAFVEQLNTLQLKSDETALNFQAVFTSGHWYRLGGVIDRNYQPIAENIAQWAEEESAGDVDTLMANYMDSGYFATKLSGKTHYLTAQYGGQPEEFIQLEIEEIQAVLDRPLTDPDWIPDDLEEFLEPLDCPRLEPEPIGKPKFRFRQIVAIAPLVYGHILRYPLREPMQRLFADWSASSAGIEEMVFCEHWILALREYLDSDGEKRFSAKPLPIFSGELPSLPSGELLHGSELARAIHVYDRELGYPFAWYFMMLSHSSSNDALAEAVLRDQMEAYGYLPARDLKILRAWAEKPYGL